MTWGELKQLAIEMKISDDTPIFINNSFMCDEELFIPTTRRQGGVSEDCPIVAFVFKTYE